jgi:hypothetical protein
MRAPSQQRESAGAAHCYQMEFAAKAGVWLSEEIMGGLQSLGSYGDTVRKNA